MLTVITPATTGDLTVLATLKAELQVSGTEQDAYLTDLIRQASDTIARYCGRKTFGRETVLQTELRGWGIDGSILLERDLEPEIVSIDENGTALDPATDFSLDGPLLLRHYWTYGASNIPAWRDVSYRYAVPTSITYKAGFELINGLPYDLERVCLDLCASMYHSRGRDRALRSEKVLDVIEQSWFADASAQGAGGLPPDIAGRLSQYRRVIIL